MTQENTNLAACIIFSILLSAMFSFMSGTYFYTHGCLDTWKLIDEERNKAEQAGVGRYIVNKDRQVEFQYGK